MKDLLVFGVPRRDTLRKKLYVKSQLFRGEMEHEELWQVEQERNRPDDGNRYNGSTRLRLIAQWEADCVPAIYRNECEREDGNRYADSLWREIEKKKKSHFPAEVKFNNENISIRNARRQKVRNTISSAL